MNIFANDGSGAGIPRPSLLALVCFLVGATYTIEVNVIGEAALAELLLPLLALALLFNPNGRRFMGEKAFWWMLAAMLLTLGGYMLSDLVRDTAPARYLRGWGRMALVITGFIALCAIASIRKTCLWWFVAGMAVGRILYLRLVLDTPVSMWKFSHAGFGYGEPMTLLAAAAACALRPRLGAIVLMALAALSIYYDFRIQSLVCMLLAAILWARAARPARPLGSRVGHVKLAVLAGLAVGLVWMGLQLSQDAYSLDRRGVSDVGRAAGKRFALKAIAQSPFIGYGSWSRNRDFAQLYAQALREVSGTSADRFRQSDSSSATHSMILQAWVEGGLPAIAFFALLALWLPRALLTLGLRRPMDALAPLLLYFALYGLWHIFMSAFAAPLRLHLAFAATVPVMLALERRAQRVRAAKPPALRMPATLRR